METEQENDLPQLIEQLRQNVLELQKNQNYLLGQIRLLEINKASLGNNSSFYNDTVPGLLE